MDLMETLYEKLAYIDELEAKINGHNLSHASFTALQKSDLLPSSHSPSVRVV